METNGATRNHVRTTSFASFFAAFAIAFSTSPSSTWDSQQLSSNSHRCQRSLSDLSATQRNWDVLRCFAFYELNFTSSWPSTRIPEQFHPAPVATSVAVCTSCIFVLHESRHESFRVATFEFRVGPPAPPWPTAADLLWTWKNKTDQTINLLNDKFVKTC